MQLKGLVLFPTRKGQLYICKLKVHLKVDYKFFQTELMVEICSKSLVRAIGKVLLIKFS